MVASHTGPLKRGYGLFSAVRVLHTCSVPKLENILNKDQIIFSTPQIMYLLEKSETLFNSYLNYYHNWFNLPYTDKNVINIVAIASPELFLELKKNEIISSEHLTRRASLSVINILKTELFEDSLHIINILNDRALVKTFKSELGTILKNIFPRNMQDLNQNCSCFRLLRHFPKKSRWELFAQVYRTAFPNKSLEDFLKIVNSSFITLNPSRETVFKWAEIKYKATGDVNFLIYYPPSVSIRIVKAKIDVTSDMQYRQSLLRLLIATCAESKDMVSLDAVLGYIGSRHRNEDPEAYKKQIEFVLESFKEDELTKSNWMSVYQQLVLIRTEDSVHFCNYITITLKLLEYSFKADKDLFKVVASDFLKDGCNSGSFNFRSYLQNSKLEREIFLELCKLFPSVIPSSHRNFTYMQYYILYDFVQMCYDYPNQHMNLLNYPHLVCAVEAACNKKEKWDDFDSGIVTYGVAYSLNVPQNALPFLTESKILELLTVLCKCAPFIYLQSITLPLVKKKELSNFEVKIILFCLEHFKTSYCDLKETTEWLLLYHPRLLVLAFDNICSKITVKYFETSIKHYSHMGLEKIICNYLIKNWHQLDLFRQQMAVHILLLLLPEDDFVDFFEKNINVLTTRVELINEDEIRSRTVQCRLARAFKDVNEPQKYLPLLLKFCNEDFIQFSLSSLHSLLARCPENTLCSYLTTLSKQSILLQRHSIFLSCELLECDYVHNLLKNTDPSTHSILKALCLATLKCFLKTEFGDLFMLFKKFVSAITVYDKQIFCNLVEVNISKQYKSQYIEVCWKMFESVRDEKDKVNKYLNKLLEQTLYEEVIESMASDFVNSIITRYLPLEGPDRLTNIEMFAIFCLVYRESDKLANYKLVFGILKKLNKMNIQVFCDTFVDYNNRHKNSTFINEFVQHWQQNFSQVQTLNEHIILNLLVKRLDSSDEDYSKNIVDYLEQLLSELGSCILEVFSEILDEQINNIKKWNRYRLLNLMLNYKPSPTICILILQLLKPLSSDENEEVKTDYTNIIETIKMIKEPIVKCFYEIYLSNNDGVC